MDVLDSILEIVIEDILETPDDQIIEETAEDGLDLETEVQSVKDIFERSRRRLQKGKHG